MFFFYSEYLSILFLLSVCVILSSLIFLLSYLFAIQKTDQEKVSPYECGFNPFDDARTTFDVRFYLVAILFLIFDLEISFLFPWSVVLCDISFYGFWSMYLFLIILTIGFVYE